MPDYQYVDSPDSLTDRLTEHDRIGVDTEFMREKTYFAQLCLIQISTPKSIWCIDPLTENPADQFWREFLSRGWVVHSARQDIEVVFQLAATMPREIFDTQVAAALLGLPAQIGYAGLMKELFDVDLEKSHTRADWTRRPLPDAFLQYAAEDVEHLLPAADVLQERLDRKGRLDWAIQDSALLLDPSLYDTGDAQAIDRLKGARNFRGRRRAAATRLAAWREQEAIARNRPRQWILRDNVLLDVAYKLPTSTSGLGDIEGLPQKLISRVGDTLLQHVKDTANDDAGSYRPPRPPDEAQKSLLKEMQAKVAACARDLDLAAETIASKRELSSIIISGARDTRVFTGWRAELIGDDLLTLL